MDKRCLVHVIRMFDLTFIQMFHSLLYRFFPDGRSHTIRSAGYLGQWREERAWFSYVHISTSCYLLVVEHSVNYG